MLAATALAVASVWAGLAVSAMFDVPASVVITTIVTVIWLVARFAAQRTGTGRAAASATHGGEPTS